MFAWQLTGSVQLVSSLNIRLTGTYFCVQIEQGNGVFGTMDYLCK